MRHSRRSLFFLALAAFVAGVAAVAQSGPDAGGRVAVEIPDGVPLSVMAADFDESEFEPRGGALVIELAGSIRFRHEGSDAVRAVTLAVQAHERMMGARAAVSAPSLHATQGEEFQIHLNLRMLRPLPVPPGPVVHIAPDAVLFNTLSAVGPNRLDSVRKMRVREMEARRDREFFLARWRSGGRGELASAMQASLRRQAARSRLSVRRATAGPVTAGPFGSPREVRFAFVQDSDAPIVLEQGSALVTGTVSDAPRIVFRNRTSRGIRRVELGWLVHDRAGNTYSVGSAPVDGDTALAAGDRLETGAGERFDIRPFESSGDLEIRSMTAYVRSVQLDDDRVWVPTRDALEESRLLDAVPVSAEEERLSQLYRQRGPEAVAQELRNLADE